MIGTTVIGRNPLNEEAINEYLALKQYGHLTQNTFATQLNKPFGTNDVFKTFLSYNRNWFAPQLVLDKLELVHNECASENWDGYDASPIEDIAFQEMRNLICALPSFISVPDVIPEPDGAIGLEWENDEGHSFIISLNGTNIINYAGMFGEDIETYGTEQFKGNIPKAILHNLKRLFEYNE